MASPFNLTAQINLRGPTNLKPIVSQIRKQLGSVNTDISLKIDNKAVKSIDATTNRLNAMNKVLVSVRNNATSLNQALRDMSSSLGTVQSASNSAASGVKRTSQNVEKVAKDIKVARTEMEEFGKQAALAIRRFAAFSVVTSGVFALTNAISGAFKEFVNFDKELVRLQQVTGRGATGVKILQDEITNLATSLGVSSAALLEVTTTLAQAGLSVEETRIALKALAKTELAPSFENLTKTTEGAIAAIRQFGLEAGELEAALGSINAVAAAFAVESGDIIAAIQRTGGVFAAASKGVTEGTDALNEFIAIFTSVRQTTRESAETIATGLRTIFTRIQRSSTIQQLKQFGVELQDLEGKFVGPFEAIRRLSDALNQLDPRDIRFSTIVEELGGFRQIGKVIPLIQQFATAQQALGVAQRGQSSLTDAQVKAQQSLANQIAKVREQFLGLIREVGQSTVFQGFFKIVLGLTSGLISLASAFKPILPILAVFGAIKGVSAIGQFATGFFGGLKKGGGAGGAGKNIGESISGAKEKQRAEATAKAADAIRLNTDALKSLTSAVQSLDSTIRSRGSTTLASGGRVLGFNRGGVVPGSGKGDKVPAMLEPGEVVMSNNAANKYGRGNLVRMNKYADGGYVKKKLPRAEQALKQTSLSYNDIDSLKIDNPGKGAIRGYLFENYVAKKYGIPAPGKEFPDIKNIKNKKREFGLTKQETGKDIIAAELKYRSGIEIKEWNDQFTRDNTAVLYAIDKKNGGQIQKFMAGSRGGIRVPSGKGRGVKKPKGARAPYYDIPNTEDFVTWAKGIYSEYDEDPSLPKASYMGLSMPVEIAYANYLLGEFLKRDGSGLSTGKKFIVTPPDKIDDALRPYLVPNPDKPDELGFFGDEEILLFQRANKTELGLSEDRRRAEELSKRKTTSKMQRQLFAFALEGVGKDIQAGNLSKEEIEIYKKGLPGIAKNPYLQVTSLPTLKDEIAPASSTLLDSIGGSLSEFRKSKGTTSLAGVIPPEAAKQIKDAIPSYIDSIKDEPQKVTKAKTALKYFDAFVSGGTAEKPGHATAFVETINQILKGGIVQGLSIGGEPQPGQLSGGPFPKGQTSSQGKTWQQILASIASQSEVLFEGSNVILSRKQKVGDKEETIQREFPLSKVLSLSQLRPNTLVGKAVGNDESVIQRLSKFRTAVIEAYNSGKQEVDEADPFNLTPEEIAAAKDIAVVGFRTDLKDLNPYYRKRNGIPLRVHTGILQGADYQDVEGLWERYYNDQIATAGRIAARRGQKPTEISEDDRKTFGIANAQGYDVEVILAALGSKGGKKTANDAVDFAGGLSDLAATVFNVPANIPSQAKLTINSGTILDSIDGIIKTFAFGGKAQGPGFEEVRQQIMDKYPEIDFRITKRKSAFGYNMLAALKSQGGLSGGAPKNFQQPTNLKQLQEQSDKLAAKLMNPEQLAVGGLIQKYEEGSDGGVELDKPQKNFGRIALRDSGSRIQATYMKEGQAGQDRAGQVIADKIDSSVYAVQSAAATGGYGPRLYDVVMEVATAQGAMLVSDRKSVSSDAKGVWDVYFSSKRSDVKKTTPLPVEYWVSNNRLLDPKLYGPPETWPPFDDPAWVLQTGYSKGPDLINSPDVVRVDPIQKAIANNEPYLPDMLNRGGFASGGSVPAMVSNGEAFVPPQIAKKIGYANLDRMNQADRNGMGKYAGGGGISVFKGPGSGTSDSIGPIGLPQGSYVIREKATKALGLNKGGSVGVQYFETGGRLSKAERKRIKEQYLAEQRGGITRDEARFVGIPRPDFGAGASRKRDATATPQGVENIKKIEAEVLNNTKKLYAEQKNRIDQLYDNLESQAREEFFSGTIDADELTDSLQALFEARILAKGQAKETLTAQLPAAQAKAVEEFKVGKQTTQIEERKAESAKYFEATVQSRMDAVAAEVKQKYQELLNQEVQSLKAFYTERAKQVKSEGGDVSAVIAEYQAAVADAKQSLEAGKRAATTQAQAAVPEQIAASKREAVEAKRSDDTERARVKAETEARAADPFYDAKKAADAYAAGGPGGGPRVNPKIAEEQKRYTQLRAEQAGLSVGGYKYSLAQKLGQNRFNVEREMTLARADTQTMVTGRRRELAGVDVAGALKAAEGGDTSQEVQRVQSVISDFTNQLQKANPALTFQEARDAAIDLATKVSEGKQSFEEIVATNETLKTSLSDTVDANAVLAESLRRTSVDTGESIENLKASVSNRQIEQQAFIQSREGQKFGILSEIAPELTQKFSKTGIGKALGNAGDFISGKGGKASKLFAKVGGVTGIGGAIAGGTEALKQFLPKSVTSDPNTAGALGALSGAGSGAAVGAQLLAGIPFGPIVGGIGGAIIGGIQGFFSAKNQAVLTNALENVAKTTGDLDQAFKKLEADSSKVNFEGAQKAFGDVLAAGQPIEDLAFAKTGFENLGSTFTGGVDKLSAGFAEGDISKIVLGGLQTAFGATGGGLLVDYFSAPTEAQRTEAIGAMVGGASQRNESAARLAESGLQFKSTEELGKIFDNIKTGTGELNPITEQYVQGALKAAEAANGTKQLTAAQTEQITAQAKERAALDAYMKKRKESGATDEQIAKEISSNRAAAKKEGEEAIKVQGELAAKQTLLARATKEVAIATESLLDVYRRISAEAQRYGDELDKFGADIDAMVANFGGDYSMREVDRTNEQVLGNVSAYSMEEVRAAANATAGYLGGTPEAQNLANQAIGQKIVQDQIPALLRTAGKDSASQDNALEAVKNLLSSQGLEGAAIDTILGDLKNELAKGEGLSEAELQDTVQKAFSTVGKGLEALQQVAKKYNDTLQQARKIQEQYNKAILEAGSYLRKATDIRLNAELDLAKALGRSPTLEELNKPFDVEIASLTGGLVETGQLAAGDAADPTAIGQALAAIPQRLEQLRAEGDAISAAGANLPQGPAGDPLRQQLVSEQLANIQAIGALNVAATEGRQALEKLANDGTKAANALAKIQEEQQAVEGFGDFAQKVFTAEPQQLAEMEMQAVALNAAQVSGPEFFKSRFNRQQAFAGLEQERGFMTRDEYNQTRASLIRKSFEAQGYQGGDVVKTIAGKDITLDELEKRLAGGIDETDPNVIEYRKATEIQAKANEALSQIYQTETERLIEKMQELGDRLINDFPDIVANAAANAQADAQTKPEVKPKEEPRKPSFAETRVAEGKAKEQEGKKLLDEAKKERANLGFWAGSEEVGAVNTKERKAREMIAAGQQTVAMYTPKAEAEAAARAQQETAAAEAKKQAEAEAKARDQEQRAKQSQDAIDRAIKAREGDRPEMARNGQRVAAGAVARPQQFAGVDDFIKTRREEEVKQRTQEVSRLGGIKGSKEEEVAKLEKRARAERIAAKAAGTYTGPTKSEQALASAQKDLESINEQITAEKQRLAALAEQAKLEEQGQTTSTPSPLDAALMTREERKAAGIPEQPPTDFNKIRAKYEELGFKGSDVFKIGGKDITLDELTNRLAGSSTSSMGLTPLVESQMSPQASPEVRNAAANFVSSYSVYGAQPSADAVNQGTRRIMSPQARAGADEATRRLRGAGFGEEGLKQKTDTEVKTATEGVQTSVAQLQSPLDLVAQMATAALQSGSIYTHDVGLQEGLKILTEVVSSVGELAASGLIVSDAQVLEALNNMQAPLANLEQMAIASLSEGINTKNDTLGDLFASQIATVSGAIGGLFDPISGITTGLSPILEAIAAPIKGIASYFGVNMTTNQAVGTAVAGPVGYAAGSAVDRLSQPKPETTPNRLELANANAANRVVSAPVPVTMPPQASFTNQQTTTPPTTPTATEGQSLTIDPSSIEKLNTFNSNFASYVDKLVTFEFPTIPDVIEMKGNHVVDVRISGAAAFEGLKKDFEKMMQAEIRKAMGKIWGQSGGQMGDRPDGTAP